MRLLLCIVITLLTAPALAFEGDTPPSPSCGLTSFCTSSKPAYTKEQLPLNLTFVGDPPAGLTHEDVKTALEHAAGVWTDVPCSFAQIQVTPAVDTMAEVPAFRASPTSVAVLFADPSTLPGCAVGENTNIIAFATCFHEGREVIAFNTRDFTWAMTPNFSQQLGDGLTVTPRTVDLPSVVTHELGHTLGLSHTNQRLPNGDFTDCAQDLPLATMAGAYLRDGGQATLSADDRLGLCAKYPNNTPTTCQNDKVCVSSLGPGSTCVQDTSTNRAVCEEPRKPLGASCSHKDLSCSDVCFFADTKTGEGFCTRLCDESNPCPGEFACDDTHTSSGNAICVPPEEPQGGCCAVVGDAQHHRTPWWGVMLALGLIWRRRSRS